MEDAAARRELRYMAAEERLTALIAQGEVKPIGVRWRFWRWVTRLFSAR